ncbi:MAG: hypothetical protein JNM00_02080, partial [Flavobacteriales bacterium]|nr:hypothetical protein [Flavobacteriales bacterium]
EKFIKHLPSEKNHLYKLILKSLRSFHGENSVSSILKQEIKNIEILYNKALFHECSKFLMRAKKLAIEYEKFYYLFELINWEKTLLEEAYEQGEFTKDLDGLIREEMDVLERLRNLAAYHVLYSKINYVFRSGGYARTEENKAIVDEIVNHPLIKGKNTALSKRAATICYYTQGFCNMAGGDYKTAIEKFQKVKDILDALPHLRADLSKRYIRTLGNMSMCLIDTGDINQARTLIDQMRGLEATAGFDTNDVQLSIFRHCAIAELQICHKTGDFHKGVKDVELMLKHLADYESTLHKEQELIFYYQVAYIYFGAGEFSKALLWINKLLNDNENTLRQDIYSYVRLFNLVIHYEMGHNDLLEYTIKSTLRFLAKRQRAHDLERMIIENFKKLIRVRTQPEKQEALKAFRNDFKKFDDSQSAVVLRFFEFSKWLDSKIENVPFAQIVRRETSFEHG